LLGEWKGVARLQQAILEATPLIVEECEFEDVLELGLHTIEGCVGDAVPARVVASWLRAIAQASGHDPRLVEFAHSIPGLGCPRSVEAGWWDGRSLALVAELEGRSLRAEEVPGGAGDEFMISVVEALRRDDPTALGDRELSARTLFDLGIDIASKLTGQLRLGALAVELRARRCTMALGNQVWGGPLYHVLANGPEELVAELVERHEFAVQCLGGDDPAKERVRWGGDDLRGRLEFKATHGVPRLLSSCRGSEDRSWDAALALALYEEGEHQTLMRVGEPTNGCAFLAGVQRAAPAERRRLLKSTRQPEGLIELIQRVREAPHDILQWLLDNSDRALPWRELGSVLPDQEFVEQSPVADLAKAESVLALLDYPECVLDMVVIEAIRAGCDACAAGLVAKCPPFRCKDWTSHGVAALLGAGEDALTAILRRFGGGWEMLTVSIVTCARQAASDRAGGGCRVPRARRESAGQTAGHKRNERSDRRSRE
jgi:hypothetical protein